MAKKSIIARNNKRIKMYERNAAKRLALKKIRNDKSKTLEERFSAQLQLAALPRNSSRVRIRNRCLLTGRPRGVYSKFQLSRICLRTLAAECKLPGVKKSSWS